jgi:hypothetical protein
MRGFPVRHPVLWVVTLGSIGTLVAAYVVASALEGDSGKHNTNHPPYPYDVQSFDDQGQEHIRPGEVRSDYNSNPPTSGPHGPAADWGVYDEAVPKESAIHNMEHGGVVVWYNCSGGLEPMDPEACFELEDQLIAIVAPDVALGKYVLMTPNSDMENRIALTGWQNLDAFDEFDGERVRAFIASFECRAGPEAERFCR